MFAAKDTQLTRPSGGFVIPRSLRFRASASAYLGRTVATTGDRQKATWSGWVKRGAIDATARGLLVGDDGAGNRDVIRFNTTEKIGIFLNDTASANLTTTQVFRDPSAWYHIVVAVDTTQATAANRIKLYVNGVQVTAFDTATYPSQNYNFLAWNVSGKVQNLGNSSLGGGQDFDGYMAEVNWIDGQQLTPTSFGATSTITGVWSPIKYGGSYGTNGYHLTFNSYATAAALGTDTSGNGNTWTVNNISVTAGVTYDSMIDVPTVSSTGSNYCVLNPVDKAAAATWSDGNLAFSQPTGAGGAKGTFAVSSGKWYWEVTPTANGQIIAAGPVTVTGALADFTGAQGGYGYYWTNGNKYINGVSSAYGAAYAINDVIGVALDMDALTITFYKNNASQGVITGVPAGTYAPFVTNGAGITTTGTYNFGQRGFTYTPPSGYSALNTYNLAAPSILKGNLYMDATTYTGTGASLGVTNAGGFQPGFVWAKSRSAATDHALYDSVRGTTKQIESNTTTAETTEATGLTAFDSAGFTVGALAQMNTSAATYVGWQWKAGSTVTNTTGSRTTSVSASTISGCSIVTGSVRGVGVQDTFGHGLGATPQLMFVKDTSGSYNWCNFHVSVSTNTSRYLRFTFDAVSTYSTVWGAALPTSSVFGLTGDGAVGANNNFVAYCFTPIAGFSTFNSYVGNGSTNGPFVYCGFRPRFILLKAYDDATDWYIYDTARDTYNVSLLELNPNSATAEQSGTYGSMDILSNGFKLRFATGEVNASGVNYAYAAFAENPFNNSLAR